MKRIGTVLAAIAIIALLVSSCNRSPESASMYNPAQIAQAIITAQENIAVLQPLFPRDEYFTEYLLHIYQLNADAIEDGVIYYADGMRADEITVLLLADSSYAAEIRDALVDYKQRRTDAFSGYAPIQAAILANGIVVVHGNYVALLICEDPQNAQSVFMACFSANPPRIRENPGLLTPGSDADLAEAQQAQEKNRPFESGNGAGNGETGNGEAGGSDAGNGEAGSGEAGGSDAGGGETGSGETGGSDAGGGETGSDEAGGSDSGSGEANGKTAEDESKKTETVDIGSKDNEINSAAPPNGQTAAQDDIYDRAAILRAWHSGDMSGLTYKNRRILEACIEVIGLIINKNMSEYEKELAIHDWIIDWVSYDEEANSNSPNASPDPDNNNPYGALFRGKAICSGYTSTFQLFMDLLGIECITIEGIYSATGQEHAWNMVRIDGEWYCVDVTWNDPIGGGDYSRHIYFNVTSQFMRETNHQWDESTTPVADAGKLFIE